MEGWKSKILVLLALLLLAKLSFQQQIINDCKGLQGMVVDDTTANYVLGGDIDCSGVAFLVIGDSSSVGEFKGVLDGKGFSVFNLTIMSQTNLTGLFAQANGATVRNINFYDVNMNSTEGDVGILFGAAYNCSISNVHVSVIQDSGLANCIIAANIGVGLCGEIYQTTISNSSLSNANLTALGTSALEVQDLTRVVGFQNVTITLYAVNTTIAHVQDFSNQNITLILNPPVNEAESAPLKLSLNSTLGGMLVVNVNSVVVNSSVNQAELVVLECEMGCSGNFDNVSVNLINRADLRNCNGIVSNSSFNGYNVTVTIEVETTECNNLPLGGSLAIALGGGFLIVVIMIVIFAVSKDTPVEVGRKRGVTFKRAHHGHGHGHGTELNEMH